MIRRSLVYGGTEYVWAHFVETHEADVYGITLQLAVTVEDDRPEEADWMTPDYVDYPYPNLARASLLITSEPGRYTLWGRVVDTPERIPLHVGKFAVV